MRGLRFLGLSLFAMGAAYAGPALAGTGVEYAPLQAAGADFAEEDLEQVDSFVVTISRGLSFTDRVLPEAMEINPVILRYEASSACPEAPRVALAVAKVGSRFWETALPTRDGAFTHSGGLVDSLRIDFENRSRRAMTCKFVVFREAVDGGDDRPSDEYKLVGALSYTGGFVQGLELALSEPLFATRVRLDVPAFCGGAEILEAGTVTEGVVDRATPVRGATATYAVNGDAGSRISAVVVSINGPQDAQCSIPVYVLD